MVFLLITIVTIILFLFPFPFPFKIKLNSILFFFFFQSVFVGRSSSETMPLSSLTGPPYPTSVPPPAYDLVSAENREGEFASPSVKAVPSNNPSSAPGYLHLQHLNIKLEIHMATSFVTMEGRWKNQYLTVRPFLFFFFFFFFHFFNLFFFVSLSTVFSKSR